MWSNTPTAIVYLVINCLRAVERFRAQTDRVSLPHEQVKSHSLARAALSEALGWADAIDNYLREGPRGNIGTNRDPNWTCGLDSDARELVEAFQRVRNLVHHAWLDALAVRISFVDGKQVKEWIWKPLRDDVGKGRGSDPRDAYYRARLEGRTLLSTLDELAAAFWERRGWQIARADVEQPGHQVLSPLRFDDE